MLASHQVINAVAQALVDAATDAGARVYTARFHPVAVFPAIRVVHVDEDLQADADDITWPASLSHALQLDVRALVRAPADLDDAMATMASQILAALGADAAPLSPLNVALQPTGIRYQASADGEAATGEAVVRFEANFTTQANAPDTIT